MIDPGDRWAAALSALGLADAEYLRASQFDAARRAYRAGDQVAKVVLLEEETTSARRTNDHRAEFAVLQRCAGIRGVPGAVELRSAPGVSALVITSVPGVPADDLSFSLRQGLILSGRLFALLARLTARGVSHNDLTPRNILVTPALRVAVVDFDQAKIGSRARALANNFIGMQSGRFGRCSLLGLLRGPLRRRLPRPIVTGYRKLARHPFAKDEPIRPSLPADATERAVMLGRAWCIATTSDATSPGFPLAYYALTVDGVALPGERPWQPRWEKLRGATSLRGKRILELGCNLALFSSFAISEESATCAMGVDVDARILEAAALVARAYHAQIEFVRQDFDEQGWEDRLASFRPDVVTALSVVQWVTDKHRFLQFLGRFPELLYEGHDPLDIERARLLGVGFDRVELIGESERSRPLLRATRTVQ